MSLYNIFDVSGSAMSAQSLRLNTTASNIANAQSVSSSTGDTYRAKHPLFKQALENSFEEQAGIGVRVEAIVTSKAPLKVQYRPEHPMADEQGNIYLPNVNVVEEMANMISASRSYQSNVEVLNTSKQMLLRTLRLGE